MPMKVTDADGKEIEVVTPDEAAAQAKEAADAAVAAATKAAEEKAAQDKAELDRLRAEERNWKELREKADKGSEAEKKAQEALEEAKKARETAEATAQKSLTETKDAAIKSLSGGNEELAKKIAHHFENSTTGPTGTKEEIEARVRNAYILATATPQPGALTGAAVSGAGGGTPAVQTPLSPEAQSLAASFGIPPDVLKKHSKVAN